MPAKARTTSTKTGKAVPGAKGRAGVKTKGTAGKATTRTKAAKPPVTKAKTRKSSAGRPKTRAETTPDGVSLPTGLDAPMLFIEFQGRLLELHPAAAGEFDSYVWLIETLGAVGGDPVGVLLGAIEARAGTDGLRARMEAVLADPASAAGMPPGADPEDAGPVGPAGHEVI